MLNKYGWRQPLAVWKSGAKVLLFQDMTKFLTQPQMPINQQFTNRKTTFQIAFQIEKGKTKSERQKNKSKKGVRLGFLSISKSTTSKTKTKKIIHSIERI